MDQDLFEWLLLLGRWVHITTAVTWIGTSIFFMWLDRSFEKNSKSTRTGHLGEVWMLHGGGFYHVEKLQMGPTPVPEHLHWFKWESYWTWMSGFYLLSLIFYTSSGTFLLDPSVSSISFTQGILISLFSLFGSWFFYDQLWEDARIQAKPLHGNIVTAAWVAGMSYFLCHTLSGRAAYMHIGAMLGTWMAANVFMRIIPRQVKMVEAAKNNKPINADWARNAKNRSTHNTYLTLPVIFIMLSNHFPMTYGHDLNWLILLIISVAGALIRQFFVIRIQKPKNSRLFLMAGVALLVAVVLLSKEPSGAPKEPEPTVAPVNAPVVVPPAETATDSVFQAVDAKIDAGSPSANTPSSNGVFNLTGFVKFEGKVPELPKIMLPQACAKKIVGEAHSNEILIKNQRIQNVLVRIVQGHEKLPIPPVPNEPVLLDQRGCFYEPRVVAARVGQEVVFINSDEVFHNVRSITQQNTAFNIGMPQKNQRESRRFSKPEILIETKCSVHPWMMAHIAVVEHPYFDVTKADGTFEIKGLPPGNYTVEFWHEKLGTKQEKLIVTDKGIEPLTETYKLQ